MLLPSTSIGGHGSSDTTREGVSRRDFVKSSLAAGVAAGAAAGSVVAQTRPAEAQQPPVNPMGRTWWPSPWGAERRARSQQPHDAGQGARGGPTHQDGPHLSAEPGARGPAFRCSARGTCRSRSPAGRRAGRSGRTCCSTTTRCSAARSARSARSSTGSATSPNKVGNDIRYYNGLTQEQVGGAYGLQKLGIHNLRPVLHARHHARRRDVQGHGAPADRLHHHRGGRHAATLRAQGLREPGEGDAVLFHTGHSKLWKKFNDEYNKGCPGPGQDRGELARRSRKIAVVGADTWPVEAVPGEDANRPFECHSIWLTMNGIFINENLNLDELVARPRVRVRVVVQPADAEGRDRLSRQLGRHRRSHRESDDEGPICFVGPSTAGSTYREVRLAGCLRAPPRSWTPLTALARVLRQAVSARDRANTSVRKRRGAGTGGSARGPRSGSRSSRRSGG